jgi:hypothetical protein
MSECSTERKTGESQVVRDELVAEIVSSEGDVHLSPWLRWTGITPAGSSNPQSLSLSELEELCDDPARDLPGGVNVRAVLTLEPEEGFYLAAQDGDRVYLIINPRGARLKFRTIEAALSVLQSVAGLSPDIGLLQATSRRHQH